MSASAYKSKRAPRWSGATLYAWVLARCEPVTINTRPMSEHSPQRGGARATQVRQPSAADVALRLGITRHSVNQMRHRMLIDVTADRYAIALGVHPCEIWPGWFDVVDIGPELEPTMPQDTPGSPFQPRTEQK